MMKRYLRGENRLAVWAFITLCVAVYWTFHTSPDWFWTRIRSILAQCRATDGALVFIGPVLSLVLNGLIGSEGKDRLVFWRRRHILPGHRAFSCLAPADPRIDMGVLASKMGTLPVDPDEQNRQWYRVYKLVEDDVVVAASHKDYLLARDLCAICFVFIVVGPMGMLLAHQAGRWILSYCGIMWLLYTVLAISGQHYGKRFVCNVLAEFTASTKGAKPKKASKKSASGKEQ